MLVVSRPSLAIAQKPAMVACGRSGPKMKYFRYGRKWPCSKIWPPRVPLASKISRCERLDPTLRSGSVKYSRRTGGIACRFRRDFVSGAAAAHDSSRTRWKSALRVFGVKSMRRTSSCSSGVSPIVAGAVTFITAYCNALPLHVPIQPRPLAAAGAMPIVRADAGTAPRSRVERPATPSTRWLRRSRDVPAPPHGLPEGSLTMLACLRCFVGDEREMIGGLVLLHGREIGCVPEQPASAGWCVPTTGEEAASRHQCGPATGPVH